MSGIPVPLILVPASALTRRNARAVPWLPFASAPPFVHLTHPVEHLGRDFQLALAARRAFDREGEGLAELDGDLGEAEPCPLAGSLGAFDRHRDDRDAGFQGDAADAWFRLAQPLGAGAAALGVDEEHLALVDEDAG